MDWGRLKWPAVAGVAGTAGWWVLRGALEEWVFSSLTSELEHNAWLVGEFLAWEWSPVVLGVILFGGIWLTASIMERRPEAAEDTSQASPLPNAPPSFSKRKGTPRSKSAAASVSSITLPPIRTLADYFAPAAPKTKRLATKGLQVTWSSGRITVLNGRVELSCWVYPKETTEVTCKVRRPDGEIDVAHINPSVGLGDTIRRIYPDDFHSAPPLTKGNYQVAWTEATWQRRHRPFTGSILVAGPNEHERFERALDSCEFVVS